MAVTKIALCGFTCLRTSFRWLHIVLEFHCHSPEWLHGISGVQLPLVECPSVISSFTPAHSVALSCPRYPPEVLVLCCPRFFSVWLNGVTWCHLNCYSLRWLSPLLWWFSVVSGVPSHCDCSMSFQVYKCNSLGCFWIILCVPLQLTEVAPCHFPCPIAIYWGGFGHLMSLSDALYHCRYFTTTHWGGSVFSQCPTVALLRGSTSSQVSYYHFLGCSKSFQVSHFPYTGVAVHHFRCPTATHWGDIVSSQVSHFSSLWWFHVKSDVPLTLIH